jgi:hypothetical protein
LLVSVGELRRIICEIIAGSAPTESYDHELMDDPAFSKQSKLVPDDIKTSLRDWSRKMGLSRKKKRKASS